MCKLLDLLCRDEDPLQSFHPAALLLFTMLTPLGQGRIWDGGGGGGGEGGGKGAEAHLFTVIIIIRLHSGPALKVWSLLGNMLKTIMNFSLNIVYVIQILINSPNKPSF